MSSWYQRAGVQDQAYKNALRSMSLMHTRLMIVAWIATLVTGLLVAVRDPLCTQNNSSNLLCKLYRAGVAGSLMCL